MTNDSIGMAIRGKTISEAWEKAVIGCWQKGLEVPTEYGEAAKEVLGMMLIIREPFCEPRIHIGDIHVAVKGSLQNYFDEIIRGTLDYAVKEGKIHYTYHERLFSYQPEEIDQISYIVEKLKKTRFSRRTQAITWRPEKDLWVNSPPCLQRIWCTVRSEKLIMHTTWRSRDIFRAMHMNILAMTKLQQSIAERIGVEVGAYLDFSNSAHIYQKSYNEVSRFIEVLKRRKSNLHPI